MNDPEIPEAPAPEISNLLLSDFPKPVSKEEEMKLAREGKLEELIMHNMRAAFNYAWLPCCSRNRAISDRERLSLCYSALSRAAKSFRPGDTAFFAYAKPFIRGEAAREWTKKNPVKNSLKGLVEDESYPTEEPQILVPTSEEMDFGEMERQEQMRLLAPILSELNEKEQSVLKLKYTDELNNEEIAEKFGVSREWIRQLHRKTIKKLRGRLARKTGLYPREHSRARFGY